jgi:hypothetical protein
VAIAEFIKRNSWEARVNQLLELFHQGEFPDG